MNDKPEYNDIITPGIHTLQIFYLERGAGKSNLTLEFNLPIVPKGSVYVSKDVEYEVAEADLVKDNNASDDEKLVLKVGDEIKNEFQKDDFAGRLYDFQVMYTTSKDLPTNWSVGEGNVMTSSLEYILYETVKPNIKTDTLYTAADGKYFSAKGV